MITFSTVKNIALALSIAIVFNVFIGVGVSTFYPGPQYEDFCDISAARGPFGEPTEAEIEEMNRCNDEFRQTQDVYNRNVFLVFLVGGVLALAAGSLAVTTPAISTGLTFGGVIAFLVGTVRWWSGMQDVLRFIVVGVVFILLLWIGTRRAIKNHAEK